MKLKKINAILALIATVGLLVHISYSVYSYLTFYYNPKLKIITAVPFMVCTCLHAICGMAIVFLRTDGSGLDVYGKQNRKTVLQRLSAALIFPLLILHINTFSALSKFSGEGKWPMFWLVIFLQVMFFAVVATHVAVSVTKAFITLGILGDIKKVRILDRIFYVIGAVMFVITIYAVLKGEMMMFLPK